MSTAALSDRGVAPGDDLGPDDARELLDRQSEVLELIARAAPLPDVLTLVLSALERLVPGARCSVLLLDRERSTLHHGAAPSLPLPYVAAIDGMSIGDGAGSCGTAAATNTPVVAVDVRTDARWVPYRGLADAAGLRSCWSTPIEGRDALPVGTFAVYRTHPHDPDRREQLLVDRFTHLAAVAIEHAGLVGDLVESEERFRRSFDDNALGMAILDPDRRVARANTALSGLAGTDALVGRPLSEVLTPRHGTLATWIDRLDPDGALPITFEAVLHRSGRGTRSEDVEVEVTVSLLHGRDGTPERYVVNVLDLTERHAAERHRRARIEAETARRTAEELSHAKSELLAAVGHDARTPMQAIVGFAELLGTMDLDEARRREALHHIGAAAGHVMDLLTDVLDLSRLEAGALPLEVEPVPVRGLVDEVVGLLSATARGRQFALTVDLADDVVRADPRRLRQVLLNLVGNAIRHGSVGGHVAVRTGAVEGTDAHGTDVVLAVDDDGPGIPPDLLPRLFTPFACGERRAPATGAAADESIGLGLALAHGLVGAMGGGLTVGRSGADGTSMLLRLPRSTDLC